MINAKLSLFTKEATVFLLVQLLGIAAAVEILNTVVLVPARMAAELNQPPISVLEFILAFLFSTLLIFFFLKIFRHSRIFFQAFFVLAIFLGAFVIFGAYLPTLAAGAVAAFIALLRYLLPRVWTQNLVMIIAVAGISVSLGFGLTWQSVIIILALLSIYDIIAVYKTKHMVALFRGLMERGAIFSVIIPTQAKKLNAKLTEVEPTLGFLFLGTGDLAFPLIFAVSVLRQYDLFNSILVIIGAFAGLGLMHLIFMSQKERRPMPALPPIALGAIVGFLVALVI